MEFTELMDFSGNKMYYIMGLARPKNNRKITKSQRVFFRYPVRSMESYKFALEKLEADCERTNLNMYMYVSVNARDTVKAYLNFKKKIAEYESQAIFGKDDFKKPLMNIDKTWYSASMKPNARGTKYFLIDIDNKDPALRIKVTDRILPYKIDVLLTQETRNGYHWITTPFNVKILEGLENVGVQKDGLLYLGSTGFEGI